MKSFKLKNKKNWVKKFRMSSLFIYKLYFLLFYCFHYLNRSFGRFVLVNIKKKKFRRPLSSRDDGGKA